MFATFDHAAEEMRTSHLPTDIEHGIAYYRELIDRFHAAVFAANERAAEQLHTEAHDLAVKLNKGDGAILGHGNAPAYVLARETAAPVGQVPLWGQTGDFVVEPRAGLRVRITMDGMFGVCARPIPGFAAHVVDRERRFISETGYRSFICFWQPSAVSGLTVDRFAEEVIRAHIRELKGKLPYLEERYRRIASTSAARV